MAIKGPDNRSTKSRFNDGSKIPTGLRFRFFLKDNQEIALNILRFLRVTVGLLAFVLFIIYYGYNLKPGEEYLILRINNSIFGFYIFSYVIRLLFSTSTLEYLKATWFEASLLLIVIYDALSLYLFNLPLLSNVFQYFEVKNEEFWHVFFIQVYLLLLVTIEFTKFSTILGSISLKPATTFIISFIILSFGGAGLLLLPEMTKEGTNLSVIDAIFTAISASCVTGLIVVDTATDFTQKGQLVIMFLIQLGGIGILTFATFFANFLKKGVGIKHQSVVKDFLSEDSLFDAKSLLKQIIILTIVIEAVGILFIYVLWDISVPFYDNPGERFYFSAFHAISAFCNAGFSLFTNGLYQDYVREAYLLHIIVAMLIICGSLGFPTLRDLFNLNNMRLRMKNPWRKWKLSTQVAIWGSAILVSFGTFVFFFTEQNATLVGKTGTEQIIISFFQSVTTRTAGFNTVDIAALATPTVVLFIFLMFIGASSGSTGGGIKTSTFFVIITAVFATIRGKKQLEISGRAISYDLLNKAFVVFIFSSTFILVALFFLTIFEPEMTILDLAFEQVSAFCTVGLSRGITADLSTPSKIILILSMFVGRVGTLTLAFSLASPVETNNYKYPKAHMLVG